MGRRRAKITETSTARKIREGYGQGFGADYKPFITTYAFPSIGRRHRISGVLTSRKHHLLSDLEQYAFMQLEWHPGVEEIREGVYLDRVRTTAIAKQLKYRQVGNAAWAMTTDLVATVWTETGRELWPISCKLARDFENKRVQEKFEIERLYWAEKGWTLRHFSEKSIDVNLVNGYSSICSFYDISGRQNPPARLYEALVTRWLNELSTPQDEPVARVCRRIDVEYGMSVGGAQAVLFHLVVHRKVYVDLSRPLDLSRPTGDFRVVPLHG